MKSLLVVFTALSMSSSAFAHVLVRTCLPETGNGQESIKVSLDRKKRKATLSVDGKGIARCQNVPYTGHLVDYGKARLVIKCQGAAAIFAQNYDEEFVNVAKLKLGLSDSTYMCN